MSHKILIVDDEPDLEPMILQRFRRAIRAGELEFVFARNGIEALEKLQSEPEIPVVLTDINMPGMDGLTLLTRLEERNTQGTPLSKAVVISAYGDLDNIRTAMNRGAFDFLTKPIDFQDVEITLHKTLDYVEELRRSRRAEEFRIAKEAAEDNFRRLQELEKSRDTLVHMIVHDLRTPLTSFSSGLQLLDSMGSLNELQRECLDIALIGADTLLGMINDLLDVSKMEAGQLELQKERIAPASVVESAVKQILQSAESKNITLEKNIAPEAPELEADARKLCRVLVNLIGNAIKFTPESGTITINVRPHDDGILYSVRDTGLGIPSEAFEHIFEKFGQLEKRQSGERASTGLGLTFCKLVVEAHDGRIWVESQLEQGSEFLFVVPVA
jgi:signal transduction histidine kinase